MKTVTWHQHARRVAFLVFEFRNFEKLVLLILGLHVSCAHFLNPECRKRSAFSFSTVSFFKHAETMNENRSKKTDEAEFENKIRGSRKDAKTPSFSENGRCYQFFCFASLRLGETFFLKR